MSKLLVFISIASFIGLLACTIASKAKFGSSRRPLREIIDLAKKGEPISLLTLISAALFIGAVSSMKCNTSDEV